MSSTINKAVNFIEPEIYKPLILLNPSMMMVFLCFYSPIILAISILSLSFMFQNFKGIIYLALLIFFCFLRYLSYMWSGADPVLNTTSICNIIEYSKYGNSTFSTFVFAFTIMYLSFPMFHNNAVNYSVFSALIFYFCIDTFYKHKKGCLTALSVILNILLGLLCGLIVLAIPEQYLFFNEISSNKEICYQPKNQTFKCSVYKNGELIGNV